MRFFVLCLLVVAASAKPFNPLTDDVTPEFIKKMLTNTLNTFGEYIPKTMATQMKELSSSEQELQRLATLMNQYRKGELVMPKDRAAALAQLQTLAPGLYNRVKIVMDEFDAKYATFSPEAKKFIDDAEARGYAAQNPDPKQAAINQMDLIVAQDTAFHALSAAAQKEITTAYPEIFKFFEGPIYKKILTMCKNPDHSKLDENIQTSMQLMGMA